jgi:hypothetical protein
MNARFADALNARFADALNAHVAKGGSNCKLLTKQRFDAYLECILANQCEDAEEKRKRILLAKEDKNVTYYQVVRDYRAIKLPGKDTWALLKISAQIPNVLEDGAPNGIRADAYHLLKRLAHVDEAYDLVREAHQAGMHSGAETTYKRLKETISNISQEIVAIYVKMCPCANYQQLQKKPYHKAILTRGLNTRGQVDLIDMTSVPDAVGGVTYNWIMNYTDHGTKLCWLRPLANKEATTVARALLEIFCMQGFPCILQSDNGREFVNRIIGCLMSTVPNCTILRGRPRHPQSNGGVERCNGTVKPMLGKWMQENGTSNWSLGVHVVQMCKNSMHHKTVSSTPYMLVYGQQMRRGLGLSSLLPKSLVANLKDEEDLEEVLTDMQLNFEDYIAKDVVPQEDGEIDDREDNIGTGAARDGAAGGDRKMNNTSEF